MADLSHSIGVAKQDRAPAWHERSPLDRESVLVPRGLERTRELQLLRFLLQLQIMKITHMMEDPEILKLLIKEIDNQYFGKILLAQQRHVHIHYIMQFIMKRMIIRLQVYMQIIIIRSDI